ncbi:hypothetical protein ZIOFF_065964 [Zingiber officinale]|uniref:Uncharacterized protein n=1 Tax=Zingiber officinale TaxID=94328 RepID=A0A8J5KHH8_ZINOF|nr:hypothetical protein ZIOFF_065964 [Zingiber officinale]
MYWTKLTLAPHLELTSDVVFTPPLALLSSPNLCPTFKSTHRDYTNPYLPVNPSAIEGTLQPTIGPDGKIKEPESNVLLASIENMQYAVTVDVLHTVFSAFGTVQKIAIFEKNGGTQALIQYPGCVSYWVFNSSVSGVPDLLCEIFNPPPEYHICSLESLLLPYYGKSDFLKGLMLLHFYMTTAAVAKEALEGHCIYDGGYCKLHLSYSRHTDLNVKAYSDKSRDYTITDTGILSNQASSVPAASASWQTNPQVGMQAAAPVGLGQLPAFASPGGAFQGQPFIPPGAPAPYPTSSALPTTSAAYLQASQQVAKYGMHPRPAGGAPYVGQPPRYF